MEYITENDFLSRYPAFENKGMAREIEIALVDSKAIIDSYIQNRFDLTGECNSPLLKRIASDLTCYFIQIRNLQAKEDDQVAQLYNHAIKLLTQIRDGELSLELKTVNSDSNAVVVISTGGSYEYR